MSTPRLPGGIGGGDKFLPDASEHFSKARASHPAPEKGDHSVPSGRELKRLKEQLLGLSENSDAKEISDVNAAIKEDSARLRALFQTLYPHKSAMDMLASEGRITIDA